MGILGTLFGESKSKSNSDNQSYGFLQNALGGAVTSGTNFFNKLGDELSGGWDDFKKKSGFDFALGEGLRGITGGAAASGTLRSGGTGKAYGNYSSGLAKQSYGNYLDRLGGMSDKSLQAAGILAGAGQRSSSTAKDNGKGLVGGLTSIFSDRRMKDNIEQVGMATNGLPIYTFSYKGDPHGTIHMGFMADEVQKLHPEAVTRDLTGFDMVDYGKAVL